MSKFNFFKPWTWFKSEERNKKEEPSIVGYSGYSSWPRPILPYKNIYFTGTSVVVVLNNGDVVMKNGVPQDIVAQIQACTTETQIYTLLSTVAPKKEQPKESVVETAEERKIVTDNLQAIRNSWDFTVVDNKVYLQDVDLEMPAVVVGSFIELLERLEKEEEHTTGWDELTNQYEALKMFWYWTALNPIESARNDLFNFVRKNEITITNNGLLMMYRRIVSVASSNTNKELVKFITDSYLKVKKWKKSAKNYSIVKNGDEYMIINKPKVRKTKKVKVVGNLAVLYRNLDQFQGDKTYTDGHTKKKDIKIGSIYKEDEDKIDLDNKKDCSNGLHVGSKTFGFQGFGDVGVLCLVNPMYVRSVPVSDTNKMRVSEMFIVGEMELDEYSENVESQQVADYSDEYCTSTVDVLKQAVKGKTYNGLKCQNNAPVLPIANLEQIVSHIKSRIEEVV